MGLHLIHLNCGLFLFLLEVRISTLLFGPQTWPTRHSSRTTHSALRFFKFFYCAKWSWFPLNILYLNPSWALNPIIQLALFEFAVAEIGCLSNGPVTCPGCETYYTQLLYTSQWGWSIDYWKSHSGSTHQAMFLQSSYFLWPKYVC